MLTPNPKALKFVRLAVRCIACAFLATAPRLPLLQAQGVAGAGPQQQPHEGSTRASSAETSRADSGPSQVLQDVSKLKLLPGSMIELHVFEEPDLDGKYRLDRQGEISVPLVGLIPLESLNLREAEAVIEAKLVESQVLKVANVIVNIAEVGGSSVTVMGEVTSPGVYPLLSSEKLIDVLSMAGGETTLAGNRIIIQHSGQPLGAGESIYYNRNGNDFAPLNAIINPGDSVIVKKAGVVYVLGAVTRPGGYVMQEAGELNVDQALALALGTSIEAKVGDIRVFRKSADGSLSEIQVSYKKINSGKATPLQLQAQDIVYVPPSRTKEVLLRGGTSVFNAAASATVYNVLY